MSTLDAQRVSMTVKCIPSAVRWYTRDRGSVVGSIEMRGGERRWRCVKMLWDVKMFWEEVSERMKKLDMLMDEDECILYSRESEMKMQPPAM
jgi:hypothetical protein